VVGIGQRDDLLNREQGGQEGSELQLHVYSH